MPHSPIVENIVALATNVPAEEFLPAYIESMVAANPDAPETLTNILVDTLSRLTGVDAPANKSESGQQKTPQAHTPQRQQRTPAPTSATRPQSARSTGRTTTTPRRNSRSTPRRPSQTVLYQSPYQGDQHGTPVAPLSPLAQVFRSFSSFGNRGGEDGLMDGARFAKLTRDCSLLTKNFTSIDVDIIFAKVKGKTERKIDYDQFQLALLMIAERRYPDLDPEAAFETVLDKVLTGGPTIRCTKIDNSYIVDKMTDVTLYTGSHRERFDMETGQGLGIVNKQEYMSNWDALPQEHYQHHDYMD